MQPSPIINTVAPRPNVLPVTPHLPQGAVQSSTEAVFSPLPALQPTSVPEVMQNSLATSPVRHEPNRGDCLGGHSTGVMMSVMIDDPIANSRYSTGYPSPPSETGPRGAGVKRRVSAFEQQTAIASIESQTASHEEPSTEAVQAGGFSLRDEILARRSLSLGTPVSSPVRMPAPSER